MRVTQGRGIIRYTIRDFQEWTEKTLGCEHTEKLVLRLKGRPQKQELCRESEWLKLSWTNVGFMFDYGYYRNTNKLQLVYACDTYFSDNVGKFATMFINEVYGTFNKAYELTENWVELWNGYNEWFDGKRERFMAKTKEKIEGTKEYKEWLDFSKKHEVSEKKKEAMLQHNPKSHGAVANLLKVLTTTLKEQGADITTIAKTQYCVCLQAGIYLPDEFITDVAVALDIENKL